MGTPHLFGVVVEQIVVVLFLQCHALLCVVPLAQVPELAAGLRFLALVVVVPGVLGRLAALLFVGQAAVRVALVVHSAVALSRLVLSGMEASAFVEQAQAQACAVKEVVYQLSEHHYHSLLYCYRR